MAKRPGRITVPKATREALLREFHHRCAICGGDRPHIHHIDEDPSHNDLANLLPLCPNCHLRDQHDPTAPMDRDKLRLFRTHRDPMILHERFHPVWSRCRFLLEVDERSLEDLRTAAEELFQFVAAFEMGQFYAKRLRELLGEPAYGRVLSIDTPSERLDQWAREQTAEYRGLLKTNRDSALALVVEMLRYQNWPVKVKGAS
jgi:hypothetical protein